MSNSIQIKDFYMEKGFALYFRKDYLVAKNSREEREEKIFIIVRVGPKPTGKGNALSKFSFSSLVLSIYFQAAFYLFPGDCKDISWGKIVHLVECSWVLILASQANVYFVIHAIPFQYHFILPWILFTSYFFKRGFVLKISF